MSGLRPHSRRRGRVGTLGSRRGRMPPPPASALRPAGRTPRARTIGRTAIAGRPTVTATVPSESTVARRACATQRIELPSWAFGNSGTRFKVFAQQGVPRDPYEKVADAAQVHRFTGVAPTVALHIPWDKVDDYARPGPPRQGPRRRLGHDQLEHVPGRRLHARQRLPPGRARPAQGRRPPARVHRHHGRDRVAGPQAVVRGRHQLPRPGRHPRPPGAARRVARDRLRAPRPGPADRPRVQVLRAGVLRDGRARLGDRAAPLPRARRPGEGRARHRPPRPGHEHRVHRRPAAARRAARRVRLQLAVLRRRRPDGRRGRPVPAVPDHARGRHRRRPGAGLGRRVHARPVPQHRAEDPGPDPLRDERPGGDGQGAARRPRGAARRPGDRATSSARTRC